MYCFAIAIAQAVGIVLLLSGFGPTLLGSVLALAAASGMAVAPGIAAVGIYFGRRSFGAIIVTAFFVEDVASNGLLPLARVQHIHIGWVRAYVRRSRGCKLGRGGVVLDAGPSPLGAVAARGESGYPLNFAITSSANRARVSEGVGYEKTMQK